MASSRQFSPVPSKDLAATTGAAMLDTMPEVHLLDRLAVVFKHMRLIAVVFAAVVSVAMLESYSATPLYKAQARIVIQDERSTAIGTLNSTDPAYGRTRAVFQHPVHASPEPRPRAANRQDDSRAAGGRAEHVDASDVAAAAGAEPLEQQPAAKPEAPARDESAIESAAIGAFLGGLEIVPVKGTRLVEIVYTSPIRNTRRWRRTRSPRSTCSRTSIQAAEHATTRSTG